MAIKVVLVPDNGVSLFLDGGTLRVARSDNATGSSERTLKSPLVVTSAESGGDSDDDDDRPRPPPDIIVTERVRDTRDPDIWRLDNAPLFNGFAHLGKAGHATLSRSSDGQRLYARMNLSDAVAVTHVQTCLEAFPANAEVVLAVGLGDG